MHTTKKIRKAAAECRKAWAAAPNATYAWCYHHREEIEKLTERAENRIQYILRFKHIDEQETRLNNFRPVSFRGFPAFDSALKIQRRALARLEKLNKRLEKLEKQQGKLARLAAYASRNVEISRERLICFAKSRRQVHKRDVPNHTWSGQRVKGTSG